MRRHNGDEQTGGAWPSDESPVGKGSGRLSKSTGGHGPAGDRLAVSRLAALRLWTAFVVVSPVPGSFHDGRTRPSSAYESRPPYSIGTVRAAW